MWKKKLKEIPSCHSDTARCDSNIRCYVVRLVFLHRRESRWGEKASKNDILKYPINHCCVDRAFFWYLEKLLDAPSSCPFSNIEYLFTRNPLAPYHLATGIQSKEEKSNFRKHVRRLFTPYLSNQ